MEDVAKVGDGIWRLTLPLPFAAPRAVNSYVFEMEDGVTILDCGVDSNVGLEALHKGLTTIGTSIEQIKRVIGSHLHVDHMAMAKRLVEDTGAEWVMHSSTPNEAIWYNDWDRRRERSATIVTANGAPPDIVARFLEGFPRPDWYSTAIDPTHPVNEGDRIPIGKDRYLEVIFTPGHQANHITLIDSRTGLLFSGDHILPGISPFVPYEADGRDNLGDYLRSIERIELLSPEIILPAHGPTIERGRARARQIGLHHQRRLGAIQQELKWGPKTAWTVMEAIFRPNLSFLDQRLAIQETLAHLQHLEEQKAVERILENDVYWYRRIR